MRVCLSSTPQDGYNHCVDIASFSRNILDAEATDIVCRNFLSRFYYIEIPKVFDIIVKKIRVGGELEITEPDFDLISRQIFREEMDLDVVNASVFGEGGLMKSFLNLELVASMVPKNFKVVSKYYGPASFCIKIKRMS